MAKRSIKGIDNAKDIYGIKWAKHPIDIVHHENKLNVPVDARMTCGHCKRFETPDHIVDHDENRSGFQTLPFPDTSK
jgi:hypothetical protein